MSNQRQDAWSEEDDLLLAETVLRHVREGSTQLLAFEEVGDQLDRTSAAVGFRWNAIVRKKYEQALKIARRQRKERKRAAATQAPASRKVEKQDPYQTRYDEPMDFENYHPLSEPKHRIEVAEELHTPTPVVSDTPREAEVRSHVPTPKSNQTVELDTVIEFLQNLKHQNTDSSTVKMRNEQLELECNNLRTQNEEFEKEIKELKNNYSSLKEDYQALLQIMDRARRMVLLQDQDELSSSKFKMDKNGNLEKVAK
ncbi:RsfA family transcriptional regulator [Pseudalkalibacillus berkeleyi]|uniref:RsfA family transcriptional regulator n=1 Tax=Pseudalkalibacillus berkeleyi TaxID=1069813 RepID=A0ABS9H2M7_9BACL|nr:RsfA family transcriptional regulator [Pseudalkalibacillus berkeleyi]MCF6138053.1 RsfA family transcriptional regulator [Pseudalkalibacillus berkeleyi]